MYDPKTGAYYSTVEQFDHEGAYRFEHNYYIKYNCQKALFAIGQLENNRGNNQNDCQTCHYYLDLLFEATGLIINRFRTSGKDSNREKQIKNNIIEYEFSDKEYPLLSNKNFRNFLEHIDEKDEVLIDKGIFFGTFNVIFPKMDDSVKNDLLNPNKKQNNILDLEKMTYSILFSPKNSDTIIPLDISIIDLKREISELGERSQTIWNYITDTLF